MLACLSWFPSLSNREAKYITVLSALEKDGGLPVSHGNEAYGALMKTKYITGKEGAVYFIQLSHVVVCMIVPKGASSSGAFTCRCEVNVASS